MVLDTAFSNKVLVFFCLLLFSLSLSGRQNPRDSKVFFYLLIYIKSAKLKSCPSNPAYDCTFNPKYKQHFERKEKTIKPIGLRVISTLQESKIPLNNIYESIFPQTLPWIIKTPKVSLELKEHSKTKTHPNTYQEKFYNILQHHPDHLYVFTDGSKDNDRAACAAVLNKTVLKKALPRESSIFTAEAHAIDQAINIISKSKHKKFIIFSDSLSVLLSLRN